MCVSSGSITLPKQYNKTIPISPNNSSLILTPPYYYAGFVHIPLRPINIRSGTTNTNMPILYLLPLVGITHLSTPHAWEIFSDFITWHRLIPPDILLRSFHRGYAYGLVVKQAFHPNVGSPSKSGSIRTSFQ